MYFKISTVATIYTCWYHIAKKKKKKKKAGIGFSP